MLVLEASLVDASYLLRIYFAHLQIKMNFLKTLRVAHGVRLVGLRFLSVNVENFPEGKMSTADMSVVISIILMEGLLSVDNALVNASLAAKLHAREQKKALCLGIGAGAVMRLLALALASWIVKYSAVKLIGAGYLIGIAVQNLCFKHGGNGAGKKNRDSFGGVVMSIMLADIAFSLDNVVAAVGMSPKFSIVVVGVMAGIIVMLFATQIIAMLMRRYPLLEQTAYGIVGFVGATIIADHFQVGVSEEMRFAVIIMAVIGTVCVHETKNFKKK
jgi:YkoY family integral membrane protein